MVTWEAAEETKRRDLWKTCYVPSNTWGAIMQWKDRQTAKAEWGRLHTCVRQSHQRKNGCRSQTTNKGLKQTSSCWGHLRWGDLHVRNSGGWGWLRIGRLTLRGLRLTLCGLWVALHTKILWGCMCKSGFPDSSSLLSLLHESASFCVLPSPWPQQRALCLQFSRPLTGLPPLPCTALLCSRVFLPHLTGSSDESGAGFYSLSSVYLPSPERFLSGGEYVHLCKCHIKQVWETGRICLKERGRGWWETSNTCYAGYKN